MFETNATSPSRLWRAAALAGALLAAAGAAQAQYFSGYSASSLYGPNPGISLTMMNTMSERAMSANMIKDLAAKSAGGTKPAAASPAASPAAGASPVPAQPQQPLTKTDFKPAGPRKVAEEISAAVHDPLEHEKMVQICRQILSTVEATPGFRKNNLASAITLVLAVSQQVLTGQQLDDAQGQALMRLINDDVVGSGAVAHWSNAQRTRAYDAMVISGGLIAGMAHNGAESGDTVMSEQARRMAREALANLKVKP